MEPSSLQPEVWAELNFGAAQLGDARSTRRLVGSAAIIAAAPGGSLPQMIQDPAALDGLYRLADSGAATHASVIGPHLLRTRELMRQALAHSDALFGPQANKIGAQQHLERFYNEFGYEQSGPMYVEDGIPHIPMVRA